MDFLRFLAQYRTPAGDIIFQGITYMAQEFFVVTLICWYFWCSDKKQAYSLGFAYFTSGLLIQGLKITFRIPRPWILDLEFQAVPSALSGATGYSFPSGHTQSITALFATLALRTRKLLLRILSFAVILAVMFSRMYLGCHTPKDVLVSFFVTLLCVCLTHSFLYKRDITQGHEKLTSGIMIAICLLLCLYAILLNRNGMITLDYAADCVKASGAGTAFAFGFFLEKRYIRFTPPDCAKEKILRMILGLLGAGILLEGIKPLIGGSLTASFIRYFLAVAWIVIIYPLLFTRKHIFQK